MNMKILFQGDSVTDAGRDRNDPHDMGSGYPRYASAMIADAYPDIEFEFVNLGISGHRTENLVARLQSDFVDVAPDMVVLLIGVNDVWHHFSHNIETTPEYFESNLRKILSTIKETMGAKLVMIEPFLLYGSDKVNMLEELDEKIRIERALAQEYADAYLPMQAIFAAETLRTPYTEFSGDGVHPNAGGAGFIAQKVLDTIEPLLSDL
jgi:lysophospholipase L1-like esterase